MDCNIIKQTGSVIISDIHRNVDDLTEEDINKSLWVEVNTSNRETVSQLVKFGLNEVIVDKLKNPGKNFRIQIVEESMVLDISIGCKDELSQACFFTVYVDKNRMITIAPDGQAFYPRISNLLGILGRTQKLSKHHIIFNILEKILDDDVSFSRELIGQIDRYAKGTIGKDLSVDVNELERLKSRVIEFEEVLENQFTAVGLIPGVDFSKNPSVLKENADRLAKGIEHLQKMIERSEDKLEYVYQKYQSNLQEKTNQKLNTLTIVQAIFVPLTFIAGIYGMNFVNMPELNWHSGYFYALVLMAVVVIFELYIFYRNGWFK